MRKSVILGSMGFALATTLAFAGIGVTPHHDARAQVTSQAPSPTKATVSKDVAVAPVERRRSDRTRGYHVPTAHKNRRAGERAHRRWRKAKSSGKRAA